MNKINLDVIEKEPIQGYSSKGDQPKWQFGNKWYKADYMGYEALTEILVSQLLKKSNVPDFVEYEPILIEYHKKEIPGCVSENFRAKDEQLVTFERLHRIYTGRSLAASIGGMETTDKLQYTVEFIEKVTGLKFVGQYLTLMLELDSFFLNEDRHTNNLAVIRNDKTKIFRLCPVFDNGLALLADMNDYQLNEDIYECISKVHAKPFDINFDIQTEAAESLYGVQLCLNFAKSDIVKQLDYLQELYPENILRRVENIMYEQMRKYGFYFR